MKSVMRKNIFGCISVILLCFFPCLLIYFKNAGEAKFIDIIPTILLYVFVAVVLSLLFFLVFKKVSKALTMTNAALIFLCNFELFVIAIRKCAYKYYVVSVVGIVLLIGIGYLLWRLNEDFVRDLNTVFAVVLTLLIMKNGLPTIPTIVHKMNVTVQKQQNIEAMQIQRVNPDGAPNVYYLIFDEYGGPQNLKELMDFDNEAFLDILREEKFNVSGNSYNMESILTNTIIPNLLNLEYVADDEMIQEERDKYLKSADLYLIMNALGYDINTCSHVVYLDNSMSKYSYQSKPTFEDKAGYWVLRRSVFVHIYDMLTNDIQGVIPSFEEEMIHSMNYCMELADLAVQEQNPQFCLAYFNAPHLPFCFQEDGRVSTKEECYQWTADNYLSYMKWVSHRMEEIAEHIVTTDPDSIVIIQSDHGARYLKWQAESNPDMELDMSKDIYQHNILNCVYYKGEQFDIDGLNGINTLRKVLNTEFGLEMEMIEFQPKAEK